MLSERRQEIKQQQQKELSRVQEDHSGRLRKIRQEYEEKVSSLRSLRIDWSSDLVLKATQ